MALSLDRELTIKRARNGIAVNDTPYSLAVVSCKEKDRDGKTYYQDVAFFFQNDMNIKEGDKLILHAEIIKAEEPKPKQGTMEFKGDTPLPF